MDVKSTAEQLFFTTVRIEAKCNSSQLSVGTGLIFSYMNQEVVYPFLVTNKHVVKDKTEGTLYFIAADGDEPRLGSGHYVDIPDFESGWFGHPEETIDVAITPFEPIHKHIRERGHSIFFKTVGIEITPTEETINGLDALEEVIFIGYPNGIWDNVNLLPVARRGFTASPLSLDFDGDKKFLVDASVFPGSSGSPVFLYNAGMYYDKKGTTNVGTRLLFLGIISSVHLINDKLVLVPIPELASTTEARSKQRINLGVVYKASTIVETIETYLGKHGVVLEKKEAGQKDE